jgi:predicted helicase
MFLNPRNSVVDVVQSVVRVMRRSPGKEYGYVILPIGVPSDQTPEEALKDNQKYKVVWQVLQALRAHDDRFNAMINKIELNQVKDDQLQVIGVPGIDPESGPFGDALPTQGMFSFPQIEEWRDSIYAKIVQKVGDRRYWETWAKRAIQTSVLAAPQVGTTAGRVAARRYRHARSGDQRQKYSGDQSDNGSETSTEGSG